MSSGQPIKAYVIVQSLKESIAAAAGNHHQLTDLIFIQNPIHRLRLANQQPSTTASLASKMFGM